MNISKCLVSNQKITELAQKFNISEKTVMTVISTWRDQDQSRTDNDYPDDKLFERFKTDLSKTLEGFTLHSGGANGSDFIWGNIGGQYGVKPNHYYTGTRSQFNAPYGNVEISEEDYEEGRYESAKAAAYNYGYQYKTMKMDQLIRDWTQVKHADSIFAIGHIVQPGEKLFPNQKDDTRVALHEAVQGGTGYAVAMAILHNKPVFVFDQEVGKWFTYDEKEGFVETETPVLTKDFAGIGSRNINEAGRKAIEQVFQNTLWDRMQPRQSGQTINIYAGTGENADLSNFAYRPVMEKSPLIGEYVTYNTVEGAFQAAKLGYTDLSAKEMADIETKLMTATGAQARSIGRTIKGLNVKEWDSNSSRIMKELIYDSFVQNPQALQRLLSTGNATLTHTQDKGKWGTEFPRILMEVRDELRKEQSQQQNQQPQQPIRQTNLIVTGSSRNTAQKAREIGGIDTLRHPDANGMHFGNPFSFETYPGVQRIVADVKEAVTAFEQWLRGEAYQYIEPERRQWIVDQINSGELYGKPLVYYTNTIQDKEGWHTYDYETFPNHAHILLKLINEQHDTGQPIGPTQKQVVVQQSVADPTKIMLTQEQQNVVDTSVEFIADRFKNPDQKREKKYITISGMAGTGKTTIVRSIIQNLRKQGFTPNIAVAAVARQAVNVLYEKTKDLNYIEPESVYSLSGVKEKDSEEEFVVDPKNNKFGQYNLIFIDEASMIDDSTFDQFDEYADKNPGLVIVYLGDYGQIRPVKNRTKKSSIFSDPRCEVLTLTQRIRQGEGSPILEYADKFYNISIGKSQENVLDIKDSKNAVQSNGTLVFVSRQQIEGNLMDAMKYAVQESNPNFIQITAYTNERVRFWNRLIHNEIFPDSPNKITRNDIIVFTKPYSKKTFNIANSTRAVVLDIREGRDFVVSNTTIKTQIARVKIDDKEYDVELVSNEDADNEGVSENQSKFGMVLEGLKREALQYPKGSFAYREAWKQYYAAADKFASIDFGYAVTVHKSQGSTYDMVVVDKDNIVTNANLSNQEKSELIYTALTRSRNISVVLQGRANMENLPASLLQLNEDINEAKHTASDKHFELVKDLGGSVESVQEIKDTVQAVKKGLDYSRIEQFYTEDESKQIQEALGGRTLNVLRASRFTDVAFFADEVVRKLEENSKIPMSDPSRINAIEIWSKHDGLPIIKILEACKKYRVAPMVSFSITSLGNTPFEKGVMKYQDLIKKISELIDKKYLDPKTTTIRIDPILVGVTSMDDIRDIVEKCYGIGIKKFVTSLVQSYDYTTGTNNDRHVVEGINKASKEAGQPYDWEKYYGRNSKGIIYFKPKLQYINEVGNVLLDIQSKHDDMALETCAFGIEGLQTSACLDPYIIQKLTGVDIFDQNGEYNRDTSRPECRCFGSRTNMFKWNEKTCSSSCVYCYAAHQQDTPFNYYDEEGNLIDNEFTRTDYDIQPVEYNDESQVQENNEVRTIIKPQLPQDFAPKESEQSRVFSVFGNKLQTRINMFARDFTNTLNKLRQEKIDELSKEKMNTTDLLNKMEQLNILKDNRFEDRKIIIDIIGGVDAVLDRMFQTYSEYASKGSEVAKRQGNTTEERQANLERFMQEYQKVVDNFDLLIKQSNPKIEKLNGLSMKIQEVDEVDEDGRNGASGNEGWGVKMHMLDLHETISSTTRGVLNNIPRLSSDGKTIERDDLYNIVYLDENEAHKMLVDICSVIDTAEDFCVYDKSQDKYVSFPVLEEANKKYKWLTAVIKYLKQHPDDVDAFYVDFRNDYFQYKTIKTVIDKLSQQSTLRLINQNEKSFLEGQFDQIQTYTTNGIILNKDMSIYDNSGKLSKFNDKTKGNIDSLIEFIDEYKKQIQYVTSSRDVTDNIISGLRKILGAIGYSCSESDIKAVLKNSDNPKSILDTVVSTANQLVKNAAKQKNEDYIIFKDNKGYYETVIKAIGMMDASMIAQTFRINGNTYTSYTKPNFVSMTAKLIKGKNYQQRLNLYRKDNTFVDQTTGKFWFEWLNQFERDENIRQKFDLFYVNTIDGVDYTEWTEKDIYKAFTLMYFLEQKDGFGSYNSPILADSPVALFVQMKKYTDGLDGTFEEQMLPLFANIVKFEMARMARVEQQNEQGTKYVANFNDNNGGLSFRFFPELNTMTLRDIYNIEDDTLFIDHYRSLLNETDGKAKADQFVEDTVNKIMDKYFDYFMQQIDKNDVRDEIKKALVDNNVASQEADFDRLMKEFYWNNVFAEMNMVHLFGVDPAYTKSGTDFQKRWKQIYASGMKPNTAGKYGQKFQTALYLSDDEFRSRSYDDIKFACDQMLAKGKITSFDRDNILDMFQKINSTDAQALRSFRSFENIMKQLGKYNEIKDCIENLKAGIWDMSDFNKVLQTIKPFTYVFVEENDGLGGTQIVPHHNKNSEFIMLAFFDIINADLNRSQKLKGISRFMEDKGVDVAMYESAVKLGCSNPINLNYSQKKVNAAVRDGFVLANKQRYQFDSSKLKTHKQIINYFENLVEQGQISQNQMNDIYDAFQMTENEVYETLSEYTQRREEDPAEYSFNPDVVHYQPFDFWGVIQPTPEHFFDALSVDGSQERNITIADLPKGMKINIHGRTFEINDDENQIARAYNDLYIEDYLCSYYGEIDKKTGQRRGGFIELFLDKEGQFELKKLVNKLQKIVEDNPKYSRQLREAIQLVKDNGTIKTRLPFTAPQMFQLQQLVFSQAKNKIINRSRTGGSAILASSVGLTKQLNVVYEYTVNGTNKEITLQEAKKLGLDTTKMRLKGVECYLPAYKKEMFSGRYIKKVTKEVEVFGNKKVIEEYEVLDIEKLRKDCPEALEAIGFRIPTENKYSITPLIIKGFLPHQNGSSIMVAADVTVLTGCDFDVDKMFLYFRDFNFDDNGKMSAIKYNPNKPIQDMTKAQRNNFLFDLKHAIMTSPETLPQFQNPGNFVKLKIYSRVSYILQNKDVLDKFVEKYGKDKNVFDLLFKNLSPKTVKFLDNFLREYTGERNICTLDTFVYNHKQNNSNLIGVYAVGGSQHMKYENGGIELIDPIRINGKELYKLDEIYTEGDQCVSKLLSEFLAASVDNVKDPVLTNMLQNISTANFSLFLIRMGMNFEELTLVFNNPVLKELFEKYGSFDMLSMKILSMIKNIRKPIDGDISKILNKFRIENITSEQLFNAIVNYNWFDKEDKNTYTVEQVLKDKDKANTLGVLLWINDLLIKQKPIGALTRISKFDSPKNAPSTLIESMNYRMQVEKFAIDVDEKYSMSYKGLAGTRNMLTLQEDLSSLDISELRRWCQTSQVNITQAAYLFGYELPLQMISQYVFAQNNTNVQKMIQRLPVTYDDSLNDVYDKLLFYNLTDTKLFGDDEQTSFAEKYKYYTQRFPSEFIELVKQNEDIADIPIIKLMTVDKSNRIVLRRSGRMKESDKEVLTRNLDQLLFSGDPVQQKLAYDLFMYSFYVEKNQVDHSSFNQLFSTMFIEQFPEYVKCCEELKQKCDSDEFLGKFEQMFYYNHLTSIAKTISDKDIFDVKDGILTPRKPKELGKQEFLMYIRKNKNNSQYDFGNSEEEPPRYYRADLTSYDEEKGGYTRYYDITDIVKLIKDNNLYYAGDMDIEEIGRILKSNAEYIDLNQPTSEGNDNSDEENPGLVEETISYAQDKEQPQNDYISGPLGDIMFMSGPVDAPILKYEITTNSTNDGIQIEYNDGTEDNLCIDLQ